MRIIDPYAPFFTYKKIIQKYGGEYSFFEKLRIGGVGSPKLGYRSGIPEFDAIHHSDDLEHSISNIELLKDGLILRINKKQKLAVAIEQLNALESIQLDSMIVKRNDRPRQEGKLTIKFKEQNPILFDIGADEYKGITTFFSKKIFGAFMK